MSDSHSRGPSILRAAHGTGADALLRAEVPPLDEHLPPDGEALARGRALAKSRGRPFEQGNTAAKGRKPALCQLGVRSTHPRHRRALAQADAYRKRRCSELAAQCGGFLSSGVSGMIASSARALASSIVVNELAADALAAGDDKTAATLFGQASRLADQSRQAELTAIAICEREAVQRREAARHWTPPPKPKPAKSGLPPADESKPLDPELLEKAKAWGIIK